MTSAGGRSADVAGSSKSWLVPLLLLMATGSLLGLSMILAKLAIGAGLSPLSFLTWSVAGAALALTAINFSSGNVCAINRRNVEYFVLAALLSVALPNLIFFSAIPHVGASFAALGVAFPPLYTYVGALLFRMERFHASRAAGVVLALSGAVYLAVLKLNVPDAPTIWIAATLFAPVILAAGNIYRSLRWPPGAKPDQLAPGMLAAGAFMLAGISLASGTPLALSLDNGFALLLLVLQAGAFCIQFILYFMLQQRGGPIFLSLMGSVAALVGVPLAMVFLSESAPPGLLIGGALIAAGIALVSATGRAKA